MGHAEQPIGTRCGQPPSGEPRGGQPSISAAGVQPEKDPGTWPPETLAELQRVLDHSRTAAGRAVRDTFDDPNRQMTAAEFVTFWNESRMKAMATVGKRGAPHIAPVHAEFVNGRLRSTIYENAVRRRDLLQQPEVALTTWGPHGAAAIVYGRAREVPGSLRETRPGKTGGPRRTVALDITVTRIYAMKGRETAP